MAARRDSERARARELRQQGWSLRKIASEVGAALSSVSVWVRDISPTASLEPATKTPASTEQLELGHRQCGRCNRELPLTSFNRHPKGRQWWCRDCYRAYFRARGQLHRDQTAGALRRRRREARAFIEDHFNTHPCCDCGVTDPLVLEFDHVGVKRANVSVLRGDGISLHRIRREIANCEVVCVNCHRMRTAVRGRSWRLDPGGAERTPALTRGERRNMAYLRDLLTRSRCVDCGEARLTVLEFDHVGDKCGNVTELARRGCSLEALQAEISNCEIRCGNCHRRRTLGRTNRDEASREEECPRRDSNPQPSP